MLRRMRDETLRLSPGEHAWFVFVRGNDAPADTFLPAARLIGKLGARISAWRSLEVLP